MSEFPDADEPSSSRRRSRPRAGGRGRRRRPWRSGSRRSPLVMAPLAIMLGGWIYHHFFVKDLSLDINSVNTIVLLLGVVLHGNVVPASRRRCSSGRACWPIVLMYHLYAGVAGLIQFTPVGEFLVDVFDPILNAATPIRSSPPSSARSSRSSSRRAADSGRFRGW